jgi:hypothetical protein
MRRKVPTQASIAVILLGIGLLLSADLEYDDVVPARTTKTMHGAVSGPLPPGTPIDAVVGGGVPRSRQGSHGQTFGRLPVDMEGMSAEAVIEQAPDFIAVLNRRGTALAGYVRITDLFGRDRVRPAPSIGDIPVYDVDGSTVIGTWIQGRGFVSSDENPVSIPTLPDPPRSAQGALG